jgi:hypothetical protein
MNADKILSKSERGDKLTDKELLYARDLLHDAFHLGVRLGTRGDMIRLWASADLYAVEGYLRNRGVEFGGHVGCKAYRFTKRDDNEQERVFAEKWQDINDEKHAKTLAHLLAEDSNARNLPRPSDRDKMVAATVIQWLGSPVGQGFLRDCGSQEDLAQHEIVQFLRYLQACGGHDGPFDLKAHLPRIQRLLDAHDQNKQRGGK